MCKFLQKQLTSIRYRKQRGKEINTSNAYTKFVRRLAAFGGTPAPSTIHGNSIVSPFAIFEERIILCKRACRDLTFYDRNFWSFKQIFFFIVWVMALVSEGDLRFIYLNRAILKSIKHRRVLTDKWNLETVNPMNCSSVKSSTGYISVIGTNQNWS